MPKIIIVIPTKNRRALLERALTSVLTQTYTAYRIVIINDGSVDGTHEYLDQLNDSRIKVIHNKESHGVNAARNIAFKTLQEGEWAVPLDDDDTFLPGAFESIVQEIAKVPNSISIICFNTIIRMPQEEFIGGREFAKGEEYYEPSYFALVTGIGLKTRGDNRPVFKWTLFPKYLFAEDINGFEGEWWLLVGRDNVGIRYVPAKTTCIDIVHEGEHLSNVASRRDPASFVRAHVRIFRAHKKFFSEHPRTAMERAPGAIKLAIRALDPIAAVYFAAWYMRSLLLTFVSSLRSKS